jgi:hypothetical protein
MASVTSTAPNSVGTSSMPTRPADRSDTEIGGRGETGVVLSEDRFQYKRVPNYQKRRSRHLVTQDISKDESVELLPQVVLGRARHACPVEPPVPNSGFGAGPGWR